MLRHLSRTPAAYQGIAAYQDPMAPGRMSTRRTQHDQQPSMRSVDPDGNNNVVNEELFLEPMMGTPLAMYIEKDVQDRDVLVDIITKHGGSVSPGYSGVPYILVDPHKESGQNLYRQYAGKKGKIVLDARWVHECVKAGALQTFHGNWANCKVTGTELVGPTGPQAAAPVVQIQPRRHSRQAAHTQSDNVSRHLQPTMHNHPQAIGPITGGPVDQMVHSQNAFPYQVYTTPLHPGPRGMHPATAAPPQTWQGANSIAPQQTHMTPPQMLSRPQAYRDDSWDGSYDHASQAPAPIVGGPNAPGYDYRYRDDQQDWVGGPNDYYDPSHYDQSYNQSAHYVPEAGPSNTGPSTGPVTETSDKTRGRKRNRTQPTPAAPASALVINRRHPPARSPTPPARVIKSTYGGNLFTAEDVQYLKKYIDYCQEQGLVLSLREICERIAVKAPHHTFYSWRRYCNKHQIRLGGYTMGSEDPEGGEPDQEEEEQQVVRAGPGPGTIAAARQRIQTEGDDIRSRSPTPPRALFRSTTGKGVAFTDEDVTFLVRFMQYRKSQGRVDMVAFWKDVASKAPHHSRASWMKFWRRHKHELDRNEGDEPLPAAPEKKMRYSREDDILLARYFHNRPEGTSDKIFQAFGRIHPHHPWKGWQEHHRIHKAKIDHFIQQLANGENIGAEDPPAE